MSESLDWRGTAVSFRPGETIAAALRQAGVDDFGPATGGLRLRYFCGIGACQGCLVSVNGGCPVEACLTPARAGMTLDFATPLAKGLRHD